MSDSEVKRIFIPEITRVEGHAAVDVEIKDGEVCAVKLDVFEGTRYFEKIVLGHHFSEIPHITSRVCAICSTGHVIAAINAFESIFQFQPSATTLALRELMHLGMIIESHATHVYALALPDFLGIPDLLEFATHHQETFQEWTFLRSLGAEIQTIIGGRPFHPVNLQVGGFSSYPARMQLSGLLEKIAEGMKIAGDLCTRLIEFRPTIEFDRGREFLALIPDGGYGYFGNTVQSSGGWQQSISGYKNYLNEQVVDYSHAKRSRGTSDRPIMVGSMARMYMFGNALSNGAYKFYAASSLSSGKANTIYNNLAQAIEILEALQRAKTIITGLPEKYPERELQDPKNIEFRAGSAVGAVECPRGTLYHHYAIDESGKVVAADMVTPSAQNTWSIEEDIRALVKAGTPNVDVQNQLETLVRAYDPCNTCATHMVAVRYV